MHEHFEIFDFKTKLSNFKIIFYGLKLHTVRDFFFRGLSMYEFRS